MNKPSLDSCSKASRRRFLTGTAMATALAVARPVIGVHGDLPGATRGTIPEDGSGALPLAFSALKPLGSRVHPITADEFHGRLVHAQKLMTEAGPNYDALFVAPGASLDYFTGIHWGVSERLLALLLPRPGDPIVIVAVF